MRSAMATRVAIHSRTREDLEEWVWSKVETWSHRVGTVA